jgi:nucleotide-binding universal stress UspA family protein
METLLAIVNEPHEARSFIVYVARLSLDLHVSVHLLHAQEPESYHYNPQASPNYAVVMQAMKNNMKHAKEELDKQVEEVQKNISHDITIDCSADVAMKSAIINDFITSKKATMVVLEGEDHKSFWSQSPSNIDIINNADCPVWIIPVKAVYKPYRRIVYATDYREEDIPTMKSLIALTYWFSPEITALHISDSVDFDEKVKKTGFNEMLRSKIGYQKITVEMLVEKDDEKSAHLINEYALNNRADLIVVLKENKGFFERIFSPSATNKILKEAQLPVLVYKY